MSNLDIINVLNKFIIHHYLLDHYLLDDIYKILGIYDLIKKNPLKYFPLVQIQTKKLCLAAVTQNKKCLKYVKNPDFDICLAAATVDNLTLIRRINCEYLDECINKINKSKYMINKGEKISKFELFEDSLILNYIVLGIAEKVKPHYSNYVKNVKKNKLNMYKRLRK